MGGSPSTNLFLPPYTHAAAMNQVAVPVELFDTELLISPLTLRDIQEINIALRHLYAKEHLSLLSTVTPLGDADLFLEVRQEVLNKTKHLTFESGEGGVYAHTSPHVFSTLFFTYLRKTPVFSIMELKERLCPLNVVSTRVLQLFAEIKDAVHCPYPKPLENKLVKKQQVSDAPTFHETLEEEYMTRIYRGLAERYHWTWDYVSGLTPYQVYVALFTLPEELEQMAEIEMQSQRLSQNGKHTSNSERPVFDLPKPKGTVQMTPEEFERFIASKNNQ